MFRKKVEVKASTLLKTSEKKKFRTSISSAFFGSSTTKLEEDENDGMPQEFRTSLVKGELASVKATTDNGTRQFEYYSLDKTPIFFAIDGNLYPTVYLSWMLPNLLPRIYTHMEVFEKLKNGADLMLPGVIVSALSTDFPADSVCSICVPGNDAAMAIGRTLMSSGEMATCEVRKGKAVQIFHAYQDNLWEQGPKTRVPTIVLSNQTKERIADERTVVGDGMDGLTLNDSAAPSIAVEGDESAAPSASDVDNDTLFLLYFLYALQKRLRRDDELPILASSFYGTVLLPLMPEGAKVTVQQTTFKKFSTFLHRMKDDGLIAIDEPKKGVENIARINRSHDIFGRYSAQLKTLRTTDNTPAQSDPSAPTVINEVPVNFRELRAITANLLPLFNVVNKGLKKGDALSSTDVRSIVTSYVKAKELSDGRIVKLDELLLKCGAGASSTEKKSFGDSITWDVLMENIFGKMTPCVEIEFADQGAGSSRKEVRKGKPPSIRMRVAKRSGNKKVTLIDNVEGFGIDAKTFAQELQVAVAGSANLNEITPGCVGPQVQVQGEQTTAVQKMLTEKYGINKKYIQVS